MPSPREPVAPPWTRAQRMNYTDLARCGPGTWSAWHPGVWSGPRQSLTAHVMKMNTLCSRHFRVCKAALRSPATRGSVIVLAVRRVAPRGPRRAA